MKYAIKVNKEGSVEKVPIFDGTKKSAKELEKFVLEEQELNTARKRFNKGLTYLFSKINWGKSNLDAEAIQFMNSIGTQLNEIEKEAKKKNVKK